MEKKFTEERPSEGQEIEVRFPSGEWLKATFYNDGIDGIVEDEDGDITEIEEHGQEMAWRTV